jgi:hypothetical protein
LRQIDEILALEIADAGFTRIPLNDRLERVVAELEVGVGETGAFDRFRRQEPARDLDLLELGVAGQLQHFHAVAQRLRNRVQTLAVQMNITFDRSYSTSR